MVLDNISVGMTIKNYKEFCKLLNEPIRGGRSKIIQLERWERAIKFHRVGKVGFQIDKIIGVDENTFARKEREFVVDVDCFNVDKINAHGCGVYIIHNTEEAYIGATTSDFRRRFFEHYNNYNEAHNNTYNILHNDGVFEMLWLADKNITGDEIQEKKQFYIDNYNDSPYLINARQGFYPVRKNEKVNNIKKYIKIPVEYLEIINQLTATHFITKITTNYVYFEIKKAC